MTVATLALSATVVAVPSAFALQETHRVHLKDLGNKQSAAESKPVCDNIRETTMAKAAP